MEKRESFKLSGHTIRRIVIAIFCIFIGVCVAYVMLNIYNPNQNSLVALSSVCMDVVCIIILFIIISSFALGAYTANNTTRIFAILLVATVWAMFLDFLNWAFDGALEFGHLTYWFTVGSLCMGSIIAAIFSLYLYSYMNGAHNLGEMRLRAIICTIINFASFILTFILAISGTAFVFEDGHYKTGALYDVVTVIPIVVVLYQVGYIIRRVKIIGIHDVVAVAGYMGFMVAGALIEATYAIGTTYVAVAIADIFIFLMLQNEVIAQEKRNVQEWMKKSRTDELTGFYNRHAYEADLKGIESSELEDDFVYVSVDVNSLKAVNDTYGHSAGDELLLGCSECMKKCFGPYGKLYRIGGDEFIALIFANDERLDFLKKDIDDYTEKWTGKQIDKLTISCGYVTKAEAKDMTMKQIANLADQRMYEAKNEYYRKTGIDRRKR